MTSGEIEVTGATLAVLDELDGLNDLTNQLLNGLDSLDNWLGQAEDILGAAQDILGQLATQADYAEAQQQALAAAISAAQSFPFLPDSLSEALSAGFTMPIRRLRVKPMPYPGSRCPQRAPTTGCRPARPKA